MSALAILALVAWVAAFVFWNVAPCIVLPLARRMGINNQALLMRLDASAFVLMLLAAVLTFAALKG